MSGHFVLKSITASDQAVAVSKGAAWGAIQHSPQPGWNAQSRQVLSQALQNQNIGNRAGLPPHRYLQFSYNNADMRDAAEQYLKGAGWADSLIRPSFMSLRALTPAATVAWGRPDPNQALLKQFQNGDAIVEIYYLSGGEMQ